MSALPARTSDAVTAVDEVAIRRTLSLYCHLCDDGRFDDWEGLWTDDAVFEVMGSRHEGPAAIRAFIEAAQPEERRGKHVTVNPLIEAGGDEATCVSDFIWIGRQGEDFSIGNAGRYHDRLRRAPDGAWQFTSRRIDLWG